MNPAPTIPTSFVPKQPVRSSGRAPRSGFNLFMLGSMFLLIMAVAGSVAVFAYGTYLNGVKESKMEALQSARQNVDASVVEEFVRTRDRFAQGDILLNSHVAASGFFDVLEEVTLTNVRYSSLDLTRLEDGTAEISVAGVARSFNALAAQSSALAKDTRFNRAIFSDIDLNENGTVGFTLTANVDADVFAFMAPETVVPPVTEPETVEEEAPLGAEEPESETIPEPEIP